MATKNKYIYVFTEKKSMIFILAGYRRIADLTKDQLARFVDMSPSMISQIEGFSKEPSDDFINKYIMFIANAFGYDIQFFKDALLEVVPKVKLSSSQALNNICFINCLRKISTRLLRKKNARDISLGEEKEVEHSLNR